MVSKSFLMTIIAGLIGFALLWSYVGFFGASAIFAAIGIVAFVFFFPRGSEGGEVEEKEREDTKDIHIFHSFESDFGSGSEPKPKHRRSGWRIHPVTGKKVKGPRF